MSKYNITDRGFMKGKALTARRTALTVLRWTIFVIYHFAYASVWVIWGIGGLQLLGDLGATIPVLATLPVLIAFLVASAMLMVVGGIGFRRDLREFLGLEPAKDYSPQRRRPIDKRRIHRSPFATSGSFWDCSP